MLVTIEPKSESIRTKFSEIQCQFDIPSLQFSPIDSPAHSISTFANPSNEERSLPVRIASATGDCAGVRERERERGFQSEIGRAHV